MPDRKDHWWHVNEGTDLDALSGAVAQVMLSYGVPFFEQCSNSAFLLELLRAGRVIPGLFEAQRPLVHAILAKHQGQLPEAEQQIREALQDAGTSTFRNTIVRVADRLGLSKLSTQEDA